MSNELHHFSAFILFLTKIEFFLQKSNSYSFCFICQLSQTPKTTRTRTKPRTWQEKIIIRNVSLNLIQDWKHKNTRQKHDICYKIIET
jgi:hypothetical protein